MATDATLLDHGGWPLSGLNQNTASVSPSANAHLVVFVCGNTGSGALDDSWNGAVVSGGGLTWTAVNADPNNPFTGGAGVYTAQCGATPGSFQITWNPTNNFDAAIYAVWEVTGGDTVAGATAQAAQAGQGAVDLVLGATPASGDAVLVMNWADASASSFGGAVLSGTWNDEHDWTTDEGQVYGTGNTAWRNDTTSATQSWTDVNAGSGDFGSSQAGVIITAAGEAPPASVRLQSPIRSTVRLR